MDKISRKDMLKAGAVGTVAALGLAAGSNPAEAAPAGGIGVQIHGTVSSLVAGAVDISISVHGTHDDLSGSGWDNLTGAEDVFNACYYSQAGSIHGNTVNLSGRVFFANDPASLAAEVTTVANLATGEITWTFAYAAGGGVFVFQGTGTVVRV